MRLSGGLSRKRKGPEGDRGLAARDHPRRKAGVRHHGYFAICCNSAIRSLSGKLLQNHFGFQGGEYISKLGAPLRSDLFGAPMLPNGPKRTRRSATAAAAIGGKADATKCLGEVPAADAEVLSFVAQLGGHVIGDAKPHHR
jgi:hypothetical protein